MDTATQMRRNGGIARAKKLTKAEKQEIGQMGGKARAANMTPAQRSRAARKAVKARWAKRGQSPSSKPRS